MSHMGDTDVDELMKTLTESFNLLADEVQLLSDRKTVLEHKLRFAHEQVRMHHLIIFIVLPFHDEKLSSRSGATFGG
jgi:hypothetical protein